jgi:hypothetical protein
MSCRCWSCAAVSCCAACSETRSHLSPITRRGVGGGAAWRIGCRLKRTSAHVCCRSTDLLALPTCDPDKTFAVQISHEETMVSGPVSFVQCALLHTSSSGERRIRWAACAAGTHPGKRALCWCCALHPAGLRCITRRCFALRHTCFQTAAPLNRCLQSTLLESVCTRARRMHWLCVRLVSNTGCR